MFALGRMHICRDTSGNDEFISGNDNFTSGNDNFSRASASWDEALVPVELLNFCIPSYIVTLLTVVIMQPFCLPRRRRTSFQRSQYSRPSLSSYIFSVSPDTLGLWTRPFNPASWSGWPDDTGVDDLPRALIETSLALLRKSVDSCVRW
jgi:hypothetical protein